MTNKAGKVVVVGAGVVGACCARALQRDGLEVVLLDAGDPGAGCSDGNAGHIAIDHIRPLARADILRKVPAMLADPLGPLTLRWRDLPRLLPWLARFARATLAEPAGTAALSGLIDGAVPAWRRELAEAGAASLLRELGTLTVYETDAGFNAAAPERRLLAAHGVTVKTLTAARIPEIAPGFRPGLRHATLYPDAAHVLDPRGVVAALVRAFAAAGGRVERHRVTGLGRAADGRPTLQTPDAVLDADAVVLAAGAGTPALAAGLGVSLPMVAECGYHLRLDGVTAPFALPVTVAERGFVLVPMAAGLRLAGTVELAAPRPAVAPHWPRADLLGRHLADLLPGLPATATSRWMGARPTLPDYLPAIGPVQNHPGFLVACGHQHIGLTTAPLTGRLIADLIARRVPPIPMAPFSPHRFGRTHA
jgi:D-amino-acid dehydrogenase